MGARRLYEESRGYYIKQINYTASALSGNYHGVYEGSFGICPVKIGN